MVYVIVLCVHLLGPCIHISLCSCEPKNLEGLDYLQCRRAPGEGNIQPIGPPEAGGAALATTGPYVVVHGSTTGLSSWVLGSLVAAAHSVVFAAPQAGMVPQVAQDYSVPQVDPMQAPQVPQAAAFPVGGRRHCGWALLGSPLCVDVVAAAKRRGGGVLGSWETA